MNPADTLATYVAAAQALGRAAITVETFRDLLGAEDGLDPAALEADAAALTRAAAVTADAAAGERMAVGQLAAAWSGGSGSAATDFLVRQCADGEQLSASLGEAATVIAGLGRELSGIVEARAQATTAIDARRAGDRQSWLTHAGAVLSGLSDGPSADVVTAQIAPFVNTDVALDWAGSMRTATQSAKSAYRRALEALAGIPATRFDVPAGEPAAASGGPPARGTAGGPDGAPASDPAAPSAAPGPATPADPTTAGPAGAIPALPAVPGIGSVPDIAGSLLPMIGYLADVLGGYAGHPAPGPAAAPGRTVAARGPTAHGGTAAKGGTGGHGGTAAHRAPGGTATSAPPRAVPAAAPPPAVTAVGPAPAVALAAEAPDPPARPDPQRTPCEIAADELPQVGG